MGRCKILAFFVVAFALAISFQQAHALKCWTCSSDSKRAQKQFCAEKFDEKNIDNRDRDLSYKECIPVPNETTYCRKLTKIVENATVYSRTCYSKPANASKAECFDKTPLPSFVKNQHCELCDFDGCNDATHYGPTALLFIIPVAVTRFFLL